MNYFKPKGTNLELCTKINHMIAFMKSFITDKKGLHCYTIFQDYELYKINDDFSIHLHTENNEMYIVNTNNISVEKDEYILCLEHDSDKLTPPSFFDDDYYMDFIYLNRHDCDTIEIAIDGETQYVSTTEFNLLNEDEAFQFSTMHSNMVMDIVQYVQYFRKYNVSFRVWFNPKLEELYEVLDEEFGIQQYNLS